VTPAVATPRMTSFQDAKRLVLDQARTLGTEEVRLADSVGRALSRDLVAEVSLPPFDNSAMDGYALWSADTTGAAQDHPVILRLAGEVAAGQTLERAIRRGEAVKIMTGAPLPSGTDSVVMLEEARLRGEVVEIFHAVRPASHVRQAGEDIKQGDVALQAGRRIRHQQLGLLAGLGCAQLPVYRLPSVAVLATGSELVGIDQPLTPGKIRNSNSLTLVTLLRRFGLRPTDLGSVADERAPLLQRLEAASRHDVMLISGGVSVGAHDVVKRVLKDVGMATLFWRVNMKPGKPLLFGRWRNSVVFGLPGNPISCVVGLLEFIAPFLRKMMGEATSDDGLVQARLTRPLHKNAPNTQLFTAQLREEGGSLLVTPTPQQGSGMLSSLAQANSFIIVPETIMALQAGELVTVRPLGADAWLW